MAHGEFPGNPLKRIVHEVHRRSLWQVLAIYVAAGWVVFEVVQTLTEGLGLPGWFPSFAFVLLLIGLPVVLATAFVQEGGPAAEDSRAPVLDVGGREIDVRASGRPSTTTTRQLLTWRNATVGGILAFALWGVVAAGWVLLGGGSEAEEAGVLFSGTESRPTLAVLPFTNMSPDEENAYFADGIHEDILTHLSKIRDLTVLARTSMIRYRDTDKSVEEIARELEADAVLEGSVRRVGDQIRVVTQLIDPGTEGHLWAGTYDRSLTVNNVFAVQTDVARRVARSLEATLSPEEEARIERRPTESLAAYDLYLRGREAYQRFEDEDNEQAIRLFRSALDVDPDYALAWAGIANAFSQRTFRYGRPLAWADSAVRYARRAVELDPELAEAHKALGLAYSIIPGRGEAALEAHLRAVQLDPNNFAAANNIGVHYLERGEFDEAILWLLRAARLAPNVWIPASLCAYTYHFLGLEDSVQEWQQRVLVLNPDADWHRLLPAELALYRGETQEAVDRAEEFVQTLPGDPNAWRGAAAIAYMARRFERAVRYARESLRIRPALRWNPWWHDAPIVLGLSLLKSGEGDEALRNAMREEERRIEEGTELYPYRSRWHLAAAHAALGDADISLEWLERAYDAGFRYPRWARNDPAFDHLRDDPRFQELVDRMEADIATMRERVLEQEP